MPFYALEIGRQGQLLWKYCWTMIALGYLQMWQLVRASLQYGPRILLGRNLWLLPWKVLKLDVTARSVPTSVLPAYDVICRYAHAVVSMVIAKLERESKLTEEDEILMMHTALACATVAEQIPHVIKPGQGAMEKAMETKMTEYLYSRLLPRSMLKSLIKIILYDMQVSQVVPNADTDMEERERRFHIRRKICEAIKTVIVEFLRNSEQHRFEILEQFTRKRSKTMSKHANHFYKICLQK